jgi:hypothetical protein
MSFFGKIVQNVAQPILCQKNKTKQMGIPFNMEKVVRIWATSVIYKIAQPWRGGVA